MIVKRREQPSRRSNMAEFTLSQVVEATAGTSAHTDNIKFLDISMIDGIHFRHRSTTRLEHGGILLKLIHQKCQIGRASCRERV